jgi:hypothetical protein
MKHLKFMPAVLIVLFALAMPSISAAQYHEERLDAFLNQRPELKRELERNPNLIYDKKFREQHPDLQGFMQNHPNVWGKLAGNERWGAYGTDHAWHGADWWHEHDPGWMYQNHPDWARNHPDWQADAHAHPEWFRHPELALHHEEAVHHEHEEALHNQQAVEAAHAQAQQQQHHHQ